MFYRLQVVQGDALAWLAGHAGERFDLVVSNPPPGLLASTPPDPSSVPNNHIAYAVQWFALAATLLFNRFAGDWEVLEDEQNRPALQFWRRVIGRQTS